MEIYLNPAQTHEISQNKPPMENLIANPIGKPKSTQNPRC